MDLDIRHIPHVIYAYFVLHNFCETRGIHINPARVAAQVAEEATTQQCEHHHNVQQHSYDTAVGKKVRKSVRAYFAEYLWVYSM